MRQEAINRKGIVLSAYLGCVGEGHIATRATGAIIDFWNKANKALAELAGQGLTEDEIARVRKNLAAKVQPPSGDEVQEFYAMMAVCFGEDSEFLHLPELSGKVDKWRQSETFLALRKQPGPGVEKRRAVG